MSEIKNKIAVVYCRVSTEEQAKEGISVESQELTCCRKAKEDGCSILQIIKDEGKSAGSLKRPGMQELIQLTIGKKMNYIYTVHSDRLSRDTLDHLNLMALFQKNNIQVKFISQPNFEKEDASSKLIGTIMAGTNQFQRDVTAEKVKATMYEKAKAGYYPSLAPFGYKNVEDPKAIEKFARKIVVIDEKDALFVKEAFRLYATGEYNVFDICDILYEKGLRNSNENKIHHSKMYEMLKNTFYIGEIHWGEVDNKNGKHESLIDRDLFNRVQMMLVSKNKHCCRKRKYKWLLSGFLRCYKHNCRYTAEWHLNKSIAYYHCTKGGCGKFSEQTKMENAVAEKFKDLEFSPDFIELVISKAKNIFYERRESYESKRQGFTNQKTAYETKLKVAENKLLSGVLKDEDFKRIRTEISKEMEILDKRIYEIQKNKEINVDMTKEVIGLTKNIYETYQGATNELKRLLLGFFWEKFEVSDGLIINSVPSTLFAELIKLEKAFQKNQNTNKSIVCNNVISFDKWCPQ